jgi:uncharacterized repeat protein (TIGR03803 family)
MKTETAKTLSLLALVALWGLNSQLSVARAQTKKVYTFGMSGSGFNPVAGAMTNSDGIHAQAGLAVAGDRLYGVTSGGGNGGAGTVFAVNADGSGFTNLYEFSPLAMGFDTNGDGAWPKARLALSGDTLYGAASAGGTGAMMGGGTLFKLGTNGALFTKLLDCSPTNGTAVNGLTVCGETLYGTAQYGGTNGNGSVFTLKIDGSSFGVLHAFSSGAWTNVDGMYPAAALLGQSNVLYGSTSQGGQFGGGTLFALNTNGSGFTVLHHFTNSDGLGPCGDLALSGGVLYGTARGGGGGNNGTVFRLNADGSDFGVLYSFGPTAYDPSSNSYTNSDGAQPYGGVLLAGGMLYGTTECGGAGGSGTVFALSTNGADFTTLYNFTALDPATSTNLDGANPYGGLALSSNYLYGTACNGGLAGDGALFGLSLPTAPAPVSLSIERVGSAVLLSWPSSATGWTLEQCSGLGAGDWSPCDYTVSNDGTNQSVSIPPAAASLFFRLAR